MRDNTVSAVLQRLGVDRRAPDLAGLREVYAAWCSAVSFDTSLKMIYLAEQASGPLPGWTAESFFQAWIEHGTGGTCWAGNGALHDLLDALGFDVARAIATMLPSADIRAPNHGSVIVSLDGERWIESSGRRRRGLGCLKNRPLSNRFLGSSGSRASRVSFGRYSPFRMAFPAGSNESAPTLGSGTNSTSGQLAGARSTTSST